MSEWIEITVASLPEDAGRRVLVFTPNEEESLTYRLVGHDEVRKLTDATHWRYIDKPCILVKLERVKTEFHYNLVDEQGVVLVEFPILGWHTFGRDRVHAEERAVKLVRHNVALDGWLDENIDIDIEQINDNQGKIIFTPKLKL
jgi:hypothetical protein